MTGANGVGVELMFTYSAMNNIVVGLIKFWLLCMVRNLLELDANPPSLKLACYTRLYIRIVHKQSSISAHVAIGLPGH